MATATTTKTKTKTTKKTTAKKATKKRATPKKNLVIVESPAKAKTIEKYLGRNYKVVASVGHIRDLKKSSMSIDFENNYEPQYINIRGKGPLINELKKEAKKAKQVFLASDPDREGEAISWHLSHILGLEPDDKNRVVFNEITKDAVKNAFVEPRAIDMDLVDAQQARRVLDRIVGYSISPLLWKKVKKGLSAGRVQSVALKLIIDRENEIKAFKPEDLEAQQDQRRTDDQLQGLQTKVVVDVTIVDGDLAGAGVNANAGNGILTTTSAVEIRFGFVHVRLPPS